MDGVPVLADCFGTGHCYCLDISPFLTMVRESDCLGMEGNYVSILQRAHGRSWGRATISGWRVTLCRYASGHMGKLGLGNCFGVKGKFCRYARWEELGPGTVLGWRITLCQYASGHMGKGWG